MILSFRGASHHKVDAKGRVSIPAYFRRILEAGDPNWTEGLNPWLVMVHGDRRKYLECFTMLAIGDVDARIAKMGRGTKERRVLEQLYCTQSTPITVDETGRLVLPSRLRERIGLKKTAFFAGKGDTFEIWNPETYETEMDAKLVADDNFDPDADPSIYLDGEVGG